MRNDKSNRPLFYRTDTVRNVIIEEDGEFDQSIKSDAGKPQLLLVPRQIIYDISEVREYGNRKYKDPDSWRNVEIKRYMNALYRHCLSFFENPNGVDDESGIEHYKHAACNLAFLCELLK